MSAIFRQLGTRCNPDLCRELDIAGVAAPNDAPLPGSYASCIEFETRTAKSQGEKIVNIDSDAQKDLALNDEDADSVVGGNKKAKKSAKHHKASHPAAAASHAPLMIYQATAYGPTEVSANSGDDDCAPDPSSPDATS